jgi:hypothetical protein
VGEEGSSGGGGGGAAAAAAAAVRSAQRRRSSGTRMPPPYMLSITGAWWRLKCVSGAAFLKFGLGGFFFLSFFLFRHHGCHQATLTTNHQRPTFPIFKTKGLHRQHRTPVTNTSRCNSQLPALRCSKMFDLSALSRNQSFHRKFNGEAVQHCAEPLRGANDFSSCS